jgi:hypothetical protein
MKARMEVPEDSKQIEILNKWKLKILKDWLHKIFLGKRKKGGLRKYMNENAIAISCLSIIACTSNILYL